MSRLIGECTKAFVLIAGLACLLAVEVAVDCHSTVLASHVDVPFWPSLVYGLVMWCWWGLIASMFWIGLRLSPRASSLSPSALWLHVPVGASFVLLHATLLQETIAWSVHVWPGLRQAGYDTLHYFSLRRLGSELALYGCIVGACLTAYLYLMSQEEKVRSAELERELSKAQLHALQMQIDPHFLFNTLNSVTALVKFDQKAEALETLANLHGLLRTTLASSSPEKVSLSKEVEMIESYLAIEQVRFADRLRVDLRVEPEALRGLVPCFLLQPIVENAIRHGISHRESDGIVEASAHRAGEHLHLCIRDNGPGLSEHSTLGHGIGLKNTRERLSHFYRDDYALSAKPLETGGFEVCIKIPYERMT
jgi:two-component sensor histidine kinase